MTRRKKLARWRDNPVAFIEEVVIDPETRKPFALRTFGKAQ